VPCGVVSETTEVGAAAAATDGRIYESKRKSIRVLKKNVRAELRAYDTSLTRINSHRFIYTLRVKPTVEPHVHRSERPQARTPRARDDTASKQWRANSRTRTTSKEARKAGMQRTPSPECGVVFAEQAVASSDEPDPHGARICHGSDRTSLKRGKREAWHVLPTRTRCVRDVDAT
jgi:hypothetical protein